MGLTNGRCGMRAMLFIKQGQTKEEFCQGMRDLLKDFSESDALEAVWRKGQKAMTKAEIDILTSNISKGE